jgi:hypothetical protein
MNHELYWAAGFYEGEGHIVCTPRSYSLRLVVDQVDEWSLLRFGAAFGLGKLVRRKDRKYSGWHVYQEDAVRVARALWPLVSPRRQAQIDAALGKWETRLRGPSRIGNPTRKTQCIAGHTFTEENTYVDGRGVRHCKACRARRSRELYRSRLKVVNE